MPPTVKPSPMDGTKRNPPENGPGKGWPRELGPVVVCRRAC